MTDASATVFFPPRMGSRGTAAAAVAMVAAPFTKVLLLIWVIVVLQCFGSWGFVDMIESPICGPEFGLAVASGHGRNATLVGRSVIGREVPTGYCVVGASGLEPLTPAVSRRYSTN